MFIQEPKSKVIFVLEKYLNKIVNTVIKDKRTLEMQHPNNLLARYLPKNNKIIKPTKERKTHYLFNTY